MLPVAELMRFARCLERRQKEGAEIKPSILQEAFRFRTPEARAVADALVKFFKGAIIVTNGKPVIIQSSRPCYHAHAEAILLLTFDTPRDTCKCAGAGTYYRPECPYCRGTGK